MKVLTPRKDYPLDYSAVEKAVKGTIFEGSDGHHYLRIDLESKPFLVCLNTSYLYHFDGNDDIRGVSFAATGYSTISLS